MAGDYLCVACDESFLEEVHNIESSEMVVEMVAEMLEDAEAEHQDGKCHKRARSPSSTPSLGEAEAAHGRKRRHDRDRPRDVPRDNEEDDEDFKLREQQCRKRYTSCNWSGRT
jgi:hypothetical protein